MTFTITPTDGSLSAFFWRRSPDRGDGMADDLGQIAAPTDGLRSFVTKLAIRSRVWTFAFSGLSHVEAYGFRDYVRSTLRGAAEPFSILWTDRANVVGWSERFDTTETGWSALGASLPIVTDLSQTSPRGYASRTTLVEFTGAGRLRLQPLVDVLATDVVHFGVTAQNLEASDVDLRVDCGPAEQFVRTLPTGVGFVSVHGVLDMSDSDSTTPYVELSIDDGSAADIALARVWGSVGKRRGYRRNPAATIANARIVPSSLSIQQSRSEDAFDLGFSVYEEVA